MSGGAVFLLHSDNTTLVEMKEEPYDSEALLQALLSNYPALLAGEQIDTVSPRRWLLVKREASVPSRQEGGNHWSADHVFLDQDGVPTIVEVKRSTNREIRRQIVGQMLDYAANAVVYWPSAHIRSLFETHCRQTGLDPQQELRDLLGDNESDALEEERAADYWQRVETNLKQGRVRMIFVADYIPPELQRIVEFMNVQMTPAEVLAVEIRQYVGQGSRSLVPRVFGLTASAQVKTRSPVMGLTEVPVAPDKQSFLELLAKKTDQQIAQVAERVITWAAVNSWPLEWGQTSKESTCKPCLDYLNRRIIAFYVYTTGRIFIQFDQIAKIPAFSSVEKREEIRARLTSISGVTLLTKVTGVVPGVPMDVLTGQEDLERFLAVFDWIRDEARSN